MKEPRYNAEVAREHIRTAEDLVQVSQSYERGDAQSRLFIEAQVHVSLALYYQNEAQHRAMVCGDVRR